MTWGHRGTVSRRRSMIGQRIGTYRIVRELGSGGMGSVYEAVREDIGRRVAIKVLLPKHSADPQVAARFFLEARAVSIINHPGLVAIHEHGMTPDGQAYLVMEFLAGQTLRQRISEPPPLLSASVPLILQAAQALAATHDKQIVHRDLKPDNMMLVPDPVAIGGIRVKLLDFGIAKIKDSNETDGMSLKTRTGTLVGTPTYMSPEQCRSQPQIDGQSDVYALGVIFYELLAGSPPFRSAALGEMMALHLFAPPRPLRDSLPQIPPELESLVLRMLAKKPEERPTAAQVVTELSQLKVRDEALEREVEDEDHTQAALSQEQISDLANRAAASQDERSVSMQGAHVTPTPTPGSMPAPGRKRRMGLLQLGLGAALLISGGVFLVSRFDSQHRMWRGNPQHDAASDGHTTGSGDRPDASQPSSVSDRSTKDGGSDDQKQPDTSTRDAEDPVVAELLQQLSETKGSKALRLIKRAIKRSPSSAALYELACEYQIKAGKPAEAIKSCEKALSLSPSRPKARTLLLEAKQAREQAAGEPDGDKADKDKGSAGDANDSAPPAEPAPAPASTTSPKKPDAYNVDFLR